jgi:hypothetical protein
MKGLPVSNEEKINEETVPLPQAPLTVEAENVSPDLLESQPQS